jgi:polysaccharide export outer membrane protein
MTLIEALSRAGSTTPAASDQILIVRPAPGKATGPTLPDLASDSTVLKINIRDLQEGDLTKNAPLKDGDTIVVPKAQAVYVFGQVKAPGALCGLEGDERPAGALARRRRHRSRVHGTREDRRSVEGKNREIKAKLTDVVEPGDTLIVGERFF